MVDLSYMSRDRVIQDLANARLNKEGYGSQYLASKYGGQKLSDILNEFGINQTEILDAADSIRSGEVSPTQPPPATATTSQALPSKELVSQLDDVFSKQTGTGLPSVNIPLPTEKLATQLDDVFSKQTGIGIPSLQISGTDLPGTGDSLAKGNESGILSIGTPGTGFQDLGTGFGPATYDLQESIRDQARAAEDEAARTGPSLAEQQEQVRNTFLQSLQPEQESLGGRLQRAGNLASGAFTLGSQAGLTFPPIAAGLAAANTVSNVYNQAVQDRQFIPNANPLATILRAMTPQAFHRFIPGLTPGLERTVGKIPPGLGFHPTPQQIETSSTDPVSLPSKRQPVTTEDLPPPSDDLFSTDFGFSPEELSEDFGGIV